MRPVSVDGQPPRMNVFVQSLQGATPVGEPRRITGETARDISSYVWKGSDTILYAKDFGGDENFHVLAVNAQYRQGRGPDALRAGARAASRTIWKTTPTTS